MPTAAGGVTKRGMPKVSWTSASLLLALGCMEVTGFAPGHALGVATQSTNQPAQPRELSQYAYCPVEFKSKPIAKTLAVTFPDSEIFSTTTAFEIETTSNTLEDVQSFDWGSGYLFLGDGRAVRLKVTGDKFVTQRIAEIRVTCDPVMAPQKSVPVVTAGDLPGIPGFEHVSSAVVITSNQRIGLWRSTTGTSETQVILYEANGGADHKRFPVGRLATLPFAADRVFVRPGIDSPHWGVSVLSMERGTSPAVLANFLWYRIYRQHLPGDHPKK